MYKKFQNRTLYKSRVLFFYSALTILLQLDNLGSKALLSRILAKLLGGQKLIGLSIRKKFLKLVMSERGTMNFIANKRPDFIDPFVISEDEWRKILEILCHLTSILLGSR